MTKYYAMYCAYGIMWTSDRDTLIAFDSKAERDKWVESDKFDGHNWHRRDVTRRIEKQHDYDNAVPYSIWREYGAAGAHAWACTHR